MGTLCTKKSQNLSESHEKKPIVDSSSYILGKHRFKSIVKPLNEQNSSFDFNRLNFIPERKRLWDFTLASRLPRLEPITQKSSSIFNLSHLSPPSLPSPSPSPQQQLQYIDYPTNMFNRQNHRCDQCGIVFPSDEHLTKHKDRFCVGVKDSGISRQPIYSDDEDLEDNSSYYHNKNGNPTRKPLPRRDIRYESPRRKRTDELNDQNLKHVIREPINVEDHMLDNARRAQKHRNENRSQDEIYNEVLVQYDRLQRQQRDVLLQLYNLQIEQKSSKDFDAILKNTDNPSSHKSSDLLEALQQRNNSLDAERRVIQEKLEDLISTNFQPATMFNYDPHRVLHEMKEQQELNEKALDFLRERLIFSTGTRSPLPHINNRVRQAVGDNVRSSRNNYLQSGGHDASVISRYSDLEYRLRAYESYPWTTNYPEPLKQSQYKPERHVDPITDGFKLVNEENDRLQSELSEMNKKFDLLDKRTKQLEASMSNPSANYRRYAGPDPFEYEPTTASSFRRNNYNQNNNNNNNNNTNRFDPSGKNQLASSSNFDKRTSPRSSPALSLLSSNMSKLRDSLAPQSYDPVGGFTIFFDYIFDLPSNVEQCCLITSIHHPKPGLGEPSILESVMSKPYIDERTREKTNCALIATKQPVPGCPPQQALTIVIEVQTASGRDAPHTELQANAWTKFALFDSRNRLLSGRWKVPIKALPIEFNESLAIISTLPTFGRAELYYRLVNSQDASEQANAPLSPKYREFYRYPAQYRN